MRILATSDTHGSLPTITPCDIFIIAGDVCPVVGSHSPLRQAKWINEKWIPWLRSLPAEQIIVVPGNHDFVMEVYPDFVRKALPDNVHLLIHEAIELQGLKIFGTPYIPNLVNWAFYRSDEELLRLFAQIPEDLDILISHGPPLGISDRTSESHVGSGALLHHLNRADPKVLVCGHIHEGRGNYRHFATEVLNVAYLDRRYLPVQEDVLDISHFVV